MMLPSDISSPPLRFLLEDVSGEDGRKDIFGGNGSEDIFNSAAFMPSASHGTASDETPSDGDASDGDASDETAPNETTSDGDASDETAPNETTSDGDASDETTSDETPSDGDASDETAPNETTSDGDASDETAPNETTSDGDASDETTSDETAPNETTSDGDASDETTSDETPSDEIASDETTSDETAPNETTSDGDASDETTSDGDASDETPSEEDTLKADEVGSIQLGTDRKGSSIHVFPSEKLADDPFNFLSSGSLLNDGLSYSETNSFLDFLISSYPALFKRHAIGESYLNETMYVYQLGGVLKTLYLESKKNLSSNMVQKDGENLPFLNFQDKNSESTPSPWDMEAFPEILFTSLHHARESASLTTLLYFCLKILRKYNDNVPQAVYLLERREFWFVPFVNPDGYKAISELKNYAIRKNRRPTCADPLADEKDIGVDLNRNYDFMFSSIEGNVCNEEYAGTAAFSESETLTIKKLVENYKNKTMDFISTGPFKTSLNFHSYGREWIHPWNCCANKTLTSVVTDIINELKTEMNIKMGTSTSLLSYATTGEATDWYLGTQNIFSLSPEVGPDLGTPDESFWPPPSVRRQIHLENFPRILSVSMKSGLQLHLQIWKYSTDSSLPNPFSELPPLPPFVESFIKRKSSTDTSVAFALKVTSRGMAGSYGKELPFIMSDKTNSSITILNDKSLKVSTDQFYSSPLEKESSISNATANIEWTFFND
ncbi:zinc carboxypeptidase superfamily protein, partial [Cardiosporidium cionae]